MATVHTTYECAYVKVLLLVVTNFPLGISKVFLILTLNQVTPLEEINVVLMTRLGSLDLPMLTTDICDSTLLN